MGVLIRAEHVPPGQRHAAWRSIVCDTLGPLDCRIAPDAPLRGEIDAGTLGSVGVGRVRTTTPHSVHRTPGQIRQGSRELHRVVLALSGEPVLEHDGRSTRLTPGRSPSTTGGPGGFPSAGLRGPGTTSGPPRHAA
ncbi:hypothetical protein [Nonomuraea sp. NPDC050691]|uniref:AraC-like ligand-binding domain-containing protein n=1 Tax=Nonomuraea sp. NPDC050691 TaxID=3155661 RepID=UPI0033F1D78A